MLRWRFLLHWEERKTPRATCSPGHEFPILNPLTHPACANIAKGAICFCCGFAFSGMLLTLHSCFNSGHLSCPLLGGGVVVTDTETPAWMWNDRIRKTSPQTSKQLLLHKGLQ